MVSIFYYVIYSICKGLFFSPQYIQINIWLFIIWVITIILIIYNPLCEDNLAENCRNLLMAILNKFKFLCLCLILTYLISYNIRLPIVSYFSTEIGLPYFISLVLTFFTSWIFFAFIINLSTQILHNIYNGDYISLNYYSWLRNVNANKANIFLFIITIIIIIQSILFWLCALVFVLGLSILFLGLSNQNRINNYNKLAAQMPNLPLILAVATKEEEYIDFNDIDTNVDYVCIKGNMDYISLADFTQLKDLNFTFEGRFALPPAWSKGDLDLEGLDGLALNKLDDCIDKLDALGMRGEEKDVSFIY